MSSLIDPDVGVANPNFMRDKRVVELKAKHNFYVMPTFNANNLRLHTTKYKNEFDSDNLTIYSGGGYIAKSRLKSNYSRRRQGTAAGTKRTNNLRHTKHPRRFNEQLDTISQHSVNRRRALSRGANQGRREYQKPNNHTQLIQRPQEDDKQQIKKQIIEKIDHMTEEEIDKISKQLDEISRAGEHNEFDREEPEEIAKESQDFVGDLPAPHNFQEDKSTTELSEYGSQGRKDLGSVSSKRSSKSYLDKLKQDLETERAQRKKLEAEIEELKKISSEISTKLGIGAR